MFAVCVAGVVSLNLPVGTAITTAVSATSNWQELVHLAPVSEVVRLLYVILRADILETKSCLWKEDNKGFDS